jgi:carbamoylphosphate synthase large subunit
LTASEIYAETEKTVNHWLKQLTRPVLTRPLFTWPGGGFYFYSRSERRAILAQNVPAHPIKVRVVTPE